jgi:acyl carrier protein
MSEAEILLKLTPLFQRVFEDPSLVVTSVLNADQVPGWNSLSHAHMLAEVEKDFGIRFTFRELRSIQTTQDLITLLLSRRF